MAENKIGPYGQGVGGPVQNVEDPNSPSYDPATETSRDARIAKMLDHPSLSERERNFLIGIYGIDRMTSKQRSWFIGLCKKTSSLP